MTEQKFQLEDLLDDNDGYERSGGEQKPFFNFNQAYPVTITDVKPTVTRNGYLQAQVSLSFTGTEKKAGCQWIFLPAFTKEMAQSLDQEKLNKLKQTFGEKLRRFLGSAIGSDYAVYSRSEKVGKKWKLYDADGELMTPAQTKVREKEVSKTVIQAAKQLATGSDMDLIGKDLFLVITQDKKDPKRTYTNWYASAPESYPLADI